MGKRNWNLRSCARRGHATYAPYEPALRSRLAATTAAGEAWRCLRCGDFILGAPKGSGPADEAPIVLRGKALRDAFILRLLAVERFVRGLLLVVAGAAVLEFKNSQASLGDYVERHFKSWSQAAHDLNYNLDNSGVVHTLRHVLTLKSGTLTLLAAGLLAYAALQLVEGTGLWLLRRWGEYVAVVGTSVFIPLEVYELIHKITWVRILALAINIAAVLYILLTKRLFGVRGGHAAYEAERHEQSLLEVERAAAYAELRELESVPLQEGPSV